MSDWTNASLREREKAAIEAFVTRHAAKLTGDVLDYGCGQQPYRPIVEAAGGVYHPFDRQNFPGSTVSEAVGEPWPLLKRAVWDAILCTQVIQYVTNPKMTVSGFQSTLKPGGWLVMTGPTNWPEVELADLWRFTVSGAAYLMEQAGFVEIEVVSREMLGVNDIGLSLGWGAVGTPKP